MKDETKKHLSRAEHYIHATEVLLQNDEEVIATGRAYYALFCIAKALLCEKGLRSYTKHTAVHSAYGKHFSKTRKIDPKFHGWLIKAFNKRLLGDYDVDSTFTADDILKLIRQAREFLEAARQYLSKTDQG